MILEIADTILLFKEKP